MTDRYGAARWRRVGLALCLGLSVGASRSAAEPADDDYIDRTCGTLGVPNQSVAVADPPPLADCSCSSTIISPDWSDGPLLQIDVVVHVISNAAGVGDIPDDIVRSQIDVLNEDFRAYWDGPGSEGYDTRIQFALAAVDPYGEATTGITRHTNTTWFYDSGEYYEELAWDPNLYLNIYTNDADGFFGYASVKPACEPSMVGIPYDRVVCRWTVFGRPGADGGPYSSGRTMTHEIAHYLGLYHTFEGGCGSKSLCYTTGDRICDTEQTTGPRYGCPTGAQSCGSYDPIHNYMDFTYDDCMNRFTFEQANRMYCTLSNWRPDLGYGTVSAPDVASVSGYRLHQNRPNPFNPVTEIRFDLSATGPVEVAILDVNGRIVRHLVQSVEPAGSHAVRWDGTDDDGRDLASGVYFYRLRGRLIGDSGTETRRMTLLR